MLKSYPIVNIAAYKFISLDAGEPMRQAFLERCTDLALKGTILLAPEGINLFLAGTRASIDVFLAWIRSDPQFVDLEIKESGSEAQPFQRMLVKLKPEIITMRHPLIKPELGRAPAVNAATLKQWLDAGHDDNGRPVVLLDTRNGFEVDIGTFDGAVDYQIEKFSEFPEKVAQQQAAFAGKTVVTFCTGGIRCEKAAIYMQANGFDNVHQLDGGILKYFEEVGTAHYRGECFVFDERRAVDTELSPSRKQENCAITQIKRHVVG
ncbi:MAG: sulfurtransferase [Pseudomonadota bacterium]